MKLTEEEQHELQMENYKMMAYVSGKSFSDLTGQAPTRADYPENYCLIKQMFLKNCVEDISSRQLYESLKNQGYPAKYGTFKGLVSYYFKMGYLQKTNYKKPFTYKLTDLGYQHSKHPYMAVDEMSEKRMCFIYSEIEKLLIDHPEIAKNIMERITCQNLGSPNIPGGYSGGNNGSQYTPNNYGSVEEMKESIESKIQDPEFFKNTDPEKLDSLISMMADGSLTVEDRENYIATIIDQLEKLNKPSMILPKQDYSGTKSIGARKYYVPLVRAIDQHVSKALYDSLPFKFIRVGNDLRLKSISEAGMYRNNKDASELGFDFVNQNFFNNQMTVKTQYDADKKELTFYYSYGNRNIKLTKMDYNDYVEAKNKGVIVKANIIVNDD